jgi:PiT family inorganic phosphate transporter
MEVTMLLFLSSGLFLGWSLGANDAANVFGTAVGSRMITFASAALICSVFVVLGATISGAGAAHTLSELGGVNAIAGSFMAAFSAAVTVMWMTRLGLPVSTSQAVVGAIIGWNLFSGSATDLDVLAKIVGTWVLAPVLGGVIGALLYPLTKKVLAASKLHLLRVDAYTRLGLILAGAFGAYALGANNIANVMGVFVHSSPFTDFSIGDLFTISSVQQLFLLGAVAISVGVYTYSKNVMLTVGRGLVPLSPVAAWVVVVAQSVVLFLFASASLEHFLASNGLPTIPLVPVSSSQAVVGAVIGIGLLQGRRNIKWSVLGNISLGWVATPLISAGVCFVALFFLQNVFNQQVFREVQYKVTGPVIEKFAERGYATAAVRPLEGQAFTSEMNLMEELAKYTDLPYQERYEIAELAKLSPVRIAPAKFEEIRKSEMLTQEQLAALEKLAGRSFDYPWMLADALGEQDPSWKFRTANTVNKMYNKELRTRLNLVLNTFGRL